jgi:hypothetical protein
MPTPGCPTSSLSHSPCGSTKTPSSGDEIVTAPCIVFNRAVRHRGAPELPRTSHLVALHNCQRRANLLCTGGRRCSSRSEPCVQVETIPTKHRNDKRVGCRLFGEVLNGGPASRKRFCVSRPARSADFVDIQGVQRHSLLSVPIRDGAAIRVSPMTAYPTDIVGGLA